MLDSFGGEKRAIVTERRVFDVRCDALLIDLRGKDRAYPGLVSRGSYAFTQRVGRYIHEQDQNGLLVKSARCEGVNGAIFKPERLSGVRHRTYLTYRLDIAGDTLRRRTHAGPEVACVRADRARLTRSRRDDAGGARSHPTLARQRARQRIIGRSRPLSRAQAIASG